MNLYYTDGAGASTPLSVISLGYQSDASPGTWENWGASTVVYVDGITSLLNVTYDAVDVGQVYDQILRLKVNASGAPIPTPAGPPAPYATPLGFSQVGFGLFAWLHGLCLQSVIQDLHHHRMTNGGLVYLMSRPCSRNIPLLCLLCLY